MKQKQLTKTFKIVSNLFMSESDVCGRQILTTKVDPRTVRVNIILMVVDPQHRYSNASERAN